MTAPFVHLRVQTSYSLARSAVRVAELSPMCAALQMPAVAVTDRNNLFAALEFSRVAPQSGVQPLIGCSLTLASSAEAGEEGGESEQAADGAVLLAQNAQGYRNLLSLLAIAYGKRTPEVRVEDFDGRSEGLIALTGTVNGPLARLLLQGRDQAAHRFLDRLRRQFPNRLYVEIGRHRLEREEAIENGLVHLAQRLSLPLVATNDVLFPTPKMFEAHRVLRCIAERKSLQEALSSDVTADHYFKSTEEMRDLFSDLSEAVANTALIAERCAFLLKPSAPRLPTYPCGARSEDETLGELALAGLTTRLTGQSSDASQRSDIPTEYRERLEYELGVIGRTGFSGYFLVVADFVDWAKGQNIPVGPGRGSGAGSLVAFAVGITDLDPIRFGLIFERFLNPERVSLPDFDIDFCQDRRDEVIRYVRAKYGADRVAQIITFGKLQARAVVRDVGRVLGAPRRQIERLVRLIPNNPAHPVTIKEAIAQEPALQEMIEADQQMARIVEIGAQLEGLHRHVSTHAAGVVISDQPLIDLIPLYRDPRTELLMTGFSMKWVETAGLVKFDFLGLRTLSVLRDATRRAQEGRGVALELDRLPLDDPATFELLGRGETVGVFQLESDGMRDILRKLHPDLFDDIVAVVALYRPGPMDNIPSYIRRKHRLEPPDYLHPRLEPVLKETYGIVIYQEQVMKIAQVLAGYTLGGADLLRRAMGKKIKSEMEQQRSIFLRGAIDNGLSESAAAHIFDLVSKFAGYGFNKSHAAAYSVVSYQTAFLKANFPLEFFAAVMTFDLSNSDKLSAYRQELRRLGVELFPPDINCSGAAFIVEYDQTSSVGGGVRYALTAIKMVGGPVASAIVAERERNGLFVGLEDFCNRATAAGVNLRQIQNLIMAGAFDCFSPSRRGLLQALAQLEKHGIKKPPAAEEPALWDSLDAKPTARTSAVEAVEDDPIQRLQDEHGALGFYFSSHPLEERFGDLVEAGVTPCERLQDARSATVEVAGALVTKKERRSGKGARFSILNLSDPTGSFEVMVFSDVLSAWRGDLEKGTSLLVTCHLQRDAERVRLVAREIKPLAARLRSIPSRIEISVDAVDPLSEIEERLHARDGRGSDSLVMKVWTDCGLAVRIDVGNDLDLDRRFVESVRGVKGVRLVERVR